MEVTNRSAACDEKRLLVGEIADGLGGAPGLPRVEQQDEAVWVMFGECDFRLQPHTVGNRLVVNWQISVREPAPGLGTWWGTRRSTYHTQSAVVRLAADLVEARGTICRLLRERSPESRAG